MANITSIYPIRYTQDTIRTSAHGLITCNSSNALDLTQADIVTGITIDTDPNPYPDTVSCAMVFNIGNGWFKLDANGAAELVDTQELTDDSVLEEGNSISELSALTNIPAFTNSNLQYAIALFTTDPDNVMPKIKFSVQCTAQTPILTKTTLSPKYEWVQPVRIASVSPDIYLTGDGTIEIKAKYTDANNQVESDWVNLETLTGLNVMSLQFRVISAVINQGDESSVQDSVQLNSIKVDYMPSNSIAAPENVSEIFTITKDWRRDLHNCRVVVRHSHLDGSSIKCYAALRKKPVKVKGEDLGVVPGATTVQTWTLNNPNGVNINSVNIYNNNVKKIDGYSIDSATGQISFTEPQDTHTTCDYEYGWGAEEWTELTLDHTEEFDSFDQSVYRVAMPENNSGDVMSIAGIRLSLHTTKGVNNREYIGQGKGVLATYKLSKPVRDGQIKIRYSDLGGLELDSDKYVLDSDTRYVKVNADVGARIDASYNWESEPPVIYQVDGVFSE